MFCKLASCTKTIDLPILWSGFARGLLTCIRYTCQNMENNASTLSAPIQHPFSPSASNVPGPTSGGEAGLAGGGGNVNFKRPIIIYDVGA